MYLNILGLCTFVKVITNNSMETAELKNAITEHLNKADDKVLRIVKAVFESYEEEEVDFYDTLPDVAKKLIEKGLKDIEENRVHSHEEVMTEFRNKYNITST
jgi:flagellar motor component MotA